VDSDSYRRLETVLPETYVRAPSHGVVSSGMRCGFADCRDPRHLPGALPAL